MIRAGMFLAYAVLMSLAAPVVEGATFRFKKENDRIRISIDSEPFATYVFRDPKIPRPYFCDVHVPGGVQVTRNHPPIEGKDATDHDTFHPGIWLAFGDLDNADFWRNRAKVEVCFTAEPMAEGNVGSFAVQNKYLDGDRLICTEDCLYRFEVLPQGCLIQIESRFNGEEGFAFGDQEEMGLGIRVATPIAVKNGGTMTNSDGLKNEEAVWGKQADWCDYAGTIEGKRVGILVMTDPSNFRKSWMHARDYGFLAANPFGRNAFTKGEKSRVEVKRGESLDLGYGVLVHSGAGFDPATAYESYARLTEREKGLGPRRNWNLPCRDETQTGKESP